MLLELWPSWRLPRVLALAGKTCIPLCRSKTLQRNCQPAHAAGAVALPGLPPAICCHLTPMVVSCRTLEQNPNMVYRACLPPPAGQGAWRPWHAADKAGGTCMRGRSADSETYSRRRWPCHT